MAASASAWHMPTVLQGKKKKHWRTNLPLDLFSAGVKTATPLLLVLIVIELSDLVFAIDSIPAVFGVTQDPLIVYSSNMFAILVRFCACHSTELRDEGHWKRILTRASTVHLADSAVALHRCRWGNDRARVPREGARVVLSSCLLPPAARNSTSLRCSLSYEVLEQMLCNSNPSQAVGFVLGFIGLKMILDFGGVHIDTGVRPSCICSLPLVCLCGKLSSPKGNRLWLSHVT